MGYILLGFCFLVFTIRLIYICIFQPKYKFMRYQNNNDNPEAAQKEPEKPTENLERRTDASGRNASIKLEGAQIEFVNERGRPENFLGG